MKKLKYYFVLLFSFIFGMFFSSCVDEKDFEFDRIATPSVTPRLSLGNIAKIDLSLLDVIDFRFIADTTGCGFDTINDGHGSFMVFTMEKDTTFTPDIPSLGSIDGINMDINLELPKVNGAIVGEMYYPSLDEAMENTSIDLPTLDNGQTIEKIKFKKGSIQIAVASDLNHESYIELMSPNLRHITTGDTFKLELKIANAGQQTTNIVNTSIDLSQYEIVNDASGKINFYDRVFIKVNGTLKQEYNTNLNIEFTKLDFDVIYGNLGYFETTFAETQDLNFFSDSTISNIFKEGAFQFDDGIYLDLTTISNVGIPTEIKVNHATVSNQAGTIANLINPNTTISILSALQPHTYNTAGTRLNFITSAFSIAPNKIDYDASIKLNPNHVSGFITSDASFRIKTKFVFPFKIKISNLEYDIDLDSLDLGESADFINSAKLILDIKNGFPFEIKAQLYSFNENDVIIDSVFDNKITVQGADVDAYGSVLNFANIQYKKTEVLITSDKFDVLSKANKLKIRLTLNTSSDNNGNKPFIRLANEARMSIKVGLDVNARLGSK